jgi:transcriptional regulator with XRE-family HTH domain
MKETELLTSLGARIRAIRSSKNMTQNDLAVEFEKASMSRIESGKSNPTVRTLLKICRVLDVRIEDLFVHEHEEVPMS